MPNLHVCFCVFILTFLVCVSSLLLGLTLYASPSQRAVFFFVFGLLIVIWSQADEEEVYFHTHCTAAARALLNGDLCLSMSASPKLISAPRELCVMQSSWRLLLGTAEV